MTNTFRVDRIEHQAYAVFLRATRPFTAVTLSLIAFLLVASVSGRTNQNAEGWTPASQVFDAVLIVTAIYFGWQTRKEWAPIIWSGGPAWKAVAYASATVVLVIAAGYAQAVVAPTSLRLLDPAKPPFIMFAVLGPIAETVFFQGWVQTAFERRVGARAAFIVASVLFWAIHLQLNASLIVAVIALCYIRMRTGLLGIVAFTHAAINISMFFLV